MCKMLELTAEQINQLNGILNQVIDNEQDYTEQLVNAAYAIRNYVVIKEEEN